MLSGLGLESQVGRVGMFVADTTDREILAMICSPWPVFIGMSLLRTRQRLNDVDNKHSDGQKRPVFIYRFLTAGSIDGELVLLSELDTLLTVPQKRSTSDK